MKRALDIVVSVTALSLVSPLLLATSLAVLVVLGRPVFFKQNRPGRYGRPFELIKFRTMKPAEDGGDQLSDAERLTRFGKILRSTSLDELPELWNVLKGDMSIVGPRPLLMEYLPLYNEFQRRRHDVRPGLTGWAQVHGRNTLSWPEKFELDVWYVDNENLWVDCKVIGLTLLKIITREGVTSDGVATMNKFAGNK